MSKIYNDEVWKEVKQGTFKGYSIEGMFDGLQNLDLSNQVNEEVETKELIIDFLKRYE